MNRKRSARSPLLFDYRCDVWHSRSMEPQSCDHTLSHVDERGFLAGSWTTEKTKNATRVVCETCGKFYGYLAQGTLPPIKRPGKVPDTEHRARTGSSSCSRPVAAERQAADWQQQTANLPKCPPGSPEAETKNSSRSRPRRAIDFAELRRQVTIAQVLEIISWKPCSRRGCQLRGPCPVHKSQRQKSRIFSVNLERNAYQCFSCGSKGNQLDLYMAVTGLPVYEAAAEICEKAGAEVPVKSERC